MDRSMPVPGAQRVRRKNAAGPQGRRALFWAAGLFALTQAALGLWLWRDGLAVRDPDRHERLRVLRRRIAEAPSPPKVVVLLGSSHVLFGVRSRSMIREASAELGRPVVVTNQAFGGGGPVRSLLAMDRLRREGIVPDLVILETFLVQFDGRRDEAGSDILPADSLDGGDVALLRRHAPERADLSGGRGLDGLVPAYAQRSGLTSFLAPWLLAGVRRKQASPEDASYAPEDAAPERRARAFAIEERFYRPALHRLTLDGPPQVRAVGELVDGLRAGGTRVVFLAAPEGPAFRSWYPAGLRAKSVAWLRDLAAGRRADPVDARDWTGDEGLFFDSHHLNSAGAEAFTRWLTREVVVPRLRAAG